MHEISICEGIIKTVQTEMKDDPIENIREIHLKIGILSCVEPKVLEHVYSYMIPDTLLKNSNLKIEMVDILAGCEKCNKNFNVKNYQFICPVCGKSSSKIIEGKELQIFKIILEEPSYEEVK